MMNPQLAARERPLLTSKRMIVLLAVWMGFFCVSAVAQQGAASPAGSPQAVNPLIASSNSMNILDARRKLGVGDIINFRVVESGEAPVSLRVSDSGELEVPLIGRVPAAGKTPKELAFSIKPLLERDFYHRATVLVGLESASKEPLGRIYITGAVASQGPIDLPRDEELTVSEAVLRSGGFGDFANKRKVRLIRKNADGSVERIDVDVKNVLEGGKIGEDVVLRPDDLIVVPERLINF